MILPRLIFLEIFFEKENFQSGFHSLWHFKGTVTLYFGGCFWHVHTVAYDKASTYRRAAKDIRIFKELLHVILIRIWP